MGALDDGLDDRGVLDDASLRQCAHPEAANLAGLEHYEHHDTCSRTR